MNDRQKALLYRGYTVAWFNKDFIYFYIALSLKAGQIRYRPEHHFKTFVQTQSKLSGTSRYRWARLRLAFILLTRECLDFRLFNVPFIY